MDLPPKSYYLHNLKSEILALPGKLKLLPTKGKDEPEPPLSTGPTEYICNPRYSGLMGLVTIGTMLVKFGTVTSLTIQTSLPGKMVALTLVYLVFVLNLYVALMADWEHYRTLDRFKFAALMKTPVPYMLFIDWVVILGYPACTYWLYRRGVWEFAIGVVLVLVNTIAVFILCHVECWNHTPLKIDGKYTLNETEEKGTENNQFTVVESGSFKITLANCSETPVEGTITVVREISWGEVDSDQKISKRLEVATMEVTLPGTMLPGQQITLIPETHFEMGSLQVRGVRSFGRSVGIVVHTLVYHGENKMQHKESFTMRLGEPPADPSGTKRHCHQLDFSRSMTQIENANFPVPNNSPAPAV